MFLTLIHLIRNPLWENMGLTMVFFTSHLWKKHAGGVTFEIKSELIVDRCPYSVLVSSPIQDLHSFLHSLEVQTDPVLSVWLQVLFCSRQLSPQAAGLRICSSLETSSFVRGYSFSSVEVNTPKHIIGPIMTIRCIKTRRTTQWSGLSGCGAVCLD